MEDIDIEVNETDKQKQHNNARKHDENDDGICCECLPIITCLGIAIIFVICFVVI